MKLRPLSPLSPPEGAASMRRLALRSDAVPGLLACVPGAGRVYAHAPRAAVILEDVRTSLGRAARVIAGAGGLIATLAGARAPSHGAGAAAAPSAREQALELVRAHKAWHSLPEYERALRDAPTALDAFARARATPPPPPAVGAAATEEEEVPCETPGFADEDSDDEGGGS